MGGYRRNFEPIAFVPLRPLIVDVEVTVPVPGAMVVNIVFDQAMNQALLPAVGTFTVTSDGVPLACTPVAWTSATKLSCNTVGTPPVVSGYVKQNVLDVLCVSALGTYARKQSNVQWFP